MILYGEDALVAEWTASHIPQINFFTNFVAIGVVSGDKLIAGIVYHEYLPQFKTIQVSMAAVSPMWARKKNIKELLAYPFIRLGCFKVWSLIPVDNDMSIRVNKHIGFKREAILAHQFGKKKHAVVSRLLLPDYRRLYKD